MDRRRWKQQLSPHQHAPQWRQKWTARVDRSKQPGIEGKAKTPKPLKRNSRRQEWLRAQLEDGHRSVDIKGADQRCIRTVSDVALAYAMNI